MANVSTSKPNWVGKYLEPQLSRDENLPSSPDSVDVHALSNIDYELDVCVVVVICAARDFNIVISHADIVGVCLQILGSCHDCEVDGTLVAKCLVSPFAD